MTSSSPPERAADARTGPSRANPESPPPPRRLALPPPRRHPSAGRLARRGRARRGGPKHRAVRPPQRAGRLRPLCAIARKPGSRPEHPDMLAWIGEQWEPWGLGAVPNRLRSLLLTRGPRTISKTVALIFAEPDPTPRVVVKRPRIPE